MPVIIKALLRWNSGIVLVASLAGGFLKASFLPQLNRYFLLGYTLQIGSLFVLGAFLALHEKRLRDLVRSLGRQRGILLGLFIACFLAYPCRLDARIMARSWLIVGIGAAGILICSLEMKSFANLLRHSVAEYLGRISFSLYLLHSLWVMSLFDLFYGKYPSVAIYLAISILSLVSAHLFCVFVEEPCIQLAKDIGKRHLGRVDVQAAS